MTRKLLSVLGNSPPPTSDAGGTLRLTDLIEPKLLQEIQDRFAEATGVASIITTPEGHPITKPSKFSRLCSDVIRKTDKGLSNCMHSDAILGRPNPQGPLVSPCLSCGLWDGGASIFAGDSHVANWLIGQVRNEDLSDAKILAYAREIGADEVAFREAFDEVTQMSTERFRAVCEFLFLVANQLSSTAYQRIVQLRQEQERSALEQQLAQARKLQAVGQLAGGVAHDFNNLLTTILGHVQLLSLDVEDGTAGAQQILGQLNEIQQAGTRAAALTKQLLAFSRQQVSSPTTLDLNAVIAKFESVLRSVVPENVRFDIASQGGPNLIHADRSQVEQVILNLIVNARDAMPHGGLLRLETAHVTIDDEYLLLHPDASTGPHVRLTVSDTGVGMSQQVRERVFEPFFTTKPLGQGTGLGLATVYGVLRQARGHVSVYSEEGKGTVFRVYWPQVDGNAAELEDMPSQQAWKGTETILLCEDSPQVRLLTTRVLERAGYRVISAASGDEALTLLRRADPPPALLLTDVIMPGLNGRELAAKVSASLPRIRIVYMSGYTADVIGHHGVLDGSVRLIEKPFTNTDLLATIRRALDES